MLRPASSLVIIAALLLPLSTSSLGGDEPGTPYCFGNGCPCENDDADAGCINSSGVGSLLTAAGSASITADDITFTATDMSTTSVSLLVGSETATGGAPFFNGLLCMGGSLKRFWKHLNSGHRGTVTFDEIIAGYQTTGVVITPGETWNFQVWFRDSPPNQTPCGQSANTTNGYTVTFEP